jgi:hypothetical protein
LAGTHFQGGFGLGKKGRCHNLTGEYDKTDRYFLAVMIAAPGFQRSNIP